MDKSWSYACFVGGHANIESEGLGHLAKEDDVRQSSENIAKIKDD